MPSPRKESDVSLMIITGMASELVAMIWLRNVGTMWRMMMRMREQPASRAASTKSSSRRARKRPRTSRPKVVQPTRERITVMAKKIWVGVQSRGRAALRASQIGMVGTDCKSSIRRWITESVLPPT